MLMLPSSNANFFQILLTIASSITSITGSKPTTLDYTGQRKDSTGLL